MTGLGLYLYGFTRPEVRLAGPLTGLDETGEVALRERDHIAAVVSPVDPSDFGEPNLQDPNWVVPRACRHESIVEHILAVAPILPVRFGAVFSSPDAVDAFMSNHDREIADFLDGIQDNDEWAVKAFLDPELGTKAAIESYADLAEQQRKLPASPGTRYFREKRLLAEARKRLRDWGTSQAATLRRELEGMALASRALRLAGTHSERKNAEPVLHLALLLPRESVEVFRGRVQALGAGCDPRGLFLECTGPWPPYNFCPVLGEMPT